MSKLATYLRTLDPQLQVRWIQLNPNWRRCKLKASATGLVWKVDMRHVSGPRLAARSAESHNGDSANSGHKKWDLCKEIYSAGGRRKSSTPERGTRAHFKWCQMWGGSVPLYVFPHVHTRAPCQGGPGGAWRSRLWARALWGSYAIHMHRACASTYVWHGGGGVWLPHKIIFARLYNRTAAIAAFSCHKREDIMLPSTGTSPGKRFFSLSKLLNGQ